MRVILHIGTRKTGSTTLQRTLRANETRLERSGILYPATPDGGFKHNGLFALVRPRSPYRGRLIPHGVGGVAALGNDASQLWDGIVDRVRSTNAETIVLSNEDLFYLERDEVGLLRDLLVNLTNEIEVVAYVRPPASYYLSLMCERAKHVPRSVPPARFRARFRERLTRYRDAFCGRLEVRSAERSALLRGCIVQDFVGRMEGYPDLSVPEAEVNDTNVTPSAEAACILQELRRDARGEQGASPRAENRYVLRTLKTMPEQSPQTPARLKPGIAAGINRRHQEDLDWLRDEFGVSLEELDMAEDDPDEDPAGWTSQRLVDILDVEPAKVERTLRELLVELPRVR